MGADVRPARELAARLVAHARQDGRASASGTVDAATTAFDRVSAELSRWMGTGGCAALLNKALRKAQDDHPALAGVGVTGLPPRLHRWSESAEAQGAKEVAAGVEAALVALLDLLGRLIGDDLSTKLAEMSMTNDASDAAPSPDRVPRP